MSLLESLRSISPTFFALAILVCATIFLVVWFFDSKLHGQLVGDLDKQELQTHRLILIPSILMEVCLVLMFWINPWYLLPFFLAFYITRTIQELIDELHWHAPRCTKFESFMHLAMWCSVHAKVYLMFMWGFFLQYEGIELVPIWIHALFFLVISGMGIISIIEWRR